MVMKSLWITLGWSALALGAVGAVLPVLPTTPFVILAAIAFGKGSPALRTWIVTHRIWGGPIRDWERHGAIRRRHKLIACGMMAIVLLGSLFAGLSPLILGLQSLCMGAAALFILSRPTGPKTEQDHLTRRAAAEEHQRQKEK